MTVRLPADLDDQLGALAERRRTSKHALIVEATALLVGADAKTAHAAAIAQSVRDRYGELLTRLEDA